MPANAAAPRRGIEILVVEDEEIVAVMIVEIVQRLLDHFPGSKISFVRGKEEALAIIFSKPPDFVFLDLSLADTKHYNETLDVIDAIDERSPVMIITGKDVDRIKQEMTGRVKSEGIQILSKRDVLDPSKHGWFFNLVFSVMHAWHCRKHGQCNQEVDTLIARAREINEQLHAAKSRSAEGN